MSNRSVFAKILRLSCWTGDALLTVLAVYLAIHYRDALTVNLALALGLCVVLGGLLPLGVYFVDYLFAQNDRLMEEARAPENLREAMKRLEQLTRRVEEAAEGATKSTLVARQVPERIDEKLQLLEEAATRLQPETLNALVERLQKSPDQAAGALVSPERPSAGPEDEDEPVPFESEEVLSHVTENLPSEEHGPLPEIIPGVGPTGMEPTSPEEDSAAPTIPASELDEDPLNEEIAVESREGAEPAVPPPEEPSREPSEKKPETDGAEAAPTKKAAKAGTTKSAPKKKRARKSAAKRAAPKKKPSSAVEEMTLFEADELVPEALAPDRALLVVKAMVGIANKVYARGDAPLNWEQGIPLEPSGIGEWRLDLTGIAEPLQCELRINDAISASGPPVTLAPGERTTVSPGFPEL